MWLVLKCNCNNKKCDNKNVIKNKIETFYSNSHFDGLYLEGITFNEIEANLKDYINQADHGDKDAQYNLSVVIREEKFPSRTINLDMNLRDSMNDEFSVCPS